MKGPDENEGTVLESAECRKQTCLLCQCANSYEDMRVGGSLAFVLPQVIRSISYL